MAAASYQDTPLRVMARSAFPWLEKFDKSFQSLPSAQQEELKQSIEEKWKARRQLLTEFATKSPEERMALAKAPMSEEQIQDVSNSVRSRLASAGLSKADAETAARLAVRVRRNFEAGKQKLLDDNDRKEWQRILSSYQQRASGGRSSAEQLEQLAQDLRAYRNDPAVVERAERERYDWIQKLASGEEKGGDLTATEKARRKMLLEKGVVKFPRLPYDPRFPNTNVSKRCWINYVDFYRCVEKNGEENKFRCVEFESVMRAVCPNYWLEAWDQQRQLGVFPGQEQIYQ